MVTIFQDILQTLHSDKEVVLATVVSSNGSTPRTSGSRMLVYPDGTITGTIGGGIIEGDVIESAVKLFSGGSVKLSAYDLSNKETVEAMDLICGGKMQVLLEHINADGRDLELYKKICEQHEKNNRCLLVGRVYLESETNKIERSLYTESGEIIYSQVHGGTDSLPELADISPAQTALVEIEDELYVIEPLKPQERLILVGAGHVAKEISVLAKMVGFLVEVVDDRIDFANADRFPDADKVLVSKGFEKVFDLSVNRNCYIVIVTRGHSYDKDVLAQALKTDAGYIGMIGSRRKRDTIYQNLMVEGVDREGLKKVFCPIGLSINAETPAEIAVSVVGELIQHRAGLKEHG